MQKITLVVAASINDVIGKNNKLPWHLPKDLAYFKSVTTGGTVIMGRKTYESIGRPLPNRHNIVITQNKDYLAEGLFVTHSLTEAVAKAKQLCNSQSIHIIGGATIFEQALKFVDTIYLNRVQTEINGDTFLPKINWDKWQLNSQTLAQSDEKNCYDISFEVYKKVNH